MVSALSLGLTQLIVNSVSIYTSALRPTTIPNNNPFSYGRGNYINLPL